MIGVMAVCFFFALQLVGEITVDGFLGYVKVVHAVLYKVFLRMGIFMLASYRNVCVFELVGLEQEFCEEFFLDTVHWVGSKSLEQVLQDYLDNYALAFVEDQFKMRDAGLYRYRKDAEHYGSSPKL